MVLKLIFFANQCLWGPVYVRLTYASNHISYYFAVVPHKIA